MKFEIIPRKSVGPIQFGMKQKQLREILSWKFHELPYREERSFREDIFPEIGVSTTYDDKLLCCVAVMLEYPAESVFIGRNILDKNYSKENLERFLESVDPLIQVEIDGILSEKLGIFVNFDFDEENYEEDEPEGYIQDSVTIFKELFGIIL